MQVPIAKSGTVSPAWPARGVRLASRSSFGEIQLSYAAQGSSHLPTSCNFWRIFLAHHPELCGNSWKSLFGLSGFSGLVECGMASPFAFNRHQVGARHPAETSREGVAFDSESYIPNEKGGGLGVTLQPTRIAERLKSL